VTAKDVMPIRLGLPGIQVHQVLLDEPHALHVAVGRIAGWVRCSACGHKTRRVHQTIDTRVRDLPISGRPVTLVFAKRRFACACGTTTTESDETLEGHLSLRLRRHLVTEVIDSTVAATARRHQLGWHQVMAVMIQVAAVAFFQRRRQKVRVLAIDEKSLVKGRGGFSTIVSNAETGAVIAVLPGRCEAVLASFLSRQSREWRVGVKVVCTDMANCYRAAIRTHLPTAAHVVDRFHVTRNFCQVLCDARREAQRTRLGEPHDPALFKARYVLVTRMDRLTADQGAMLAQVLADHPELGAVWEMTQRFYRIYEAQGIEEALGAIEDFATAWMASNAELGSAVKTLLAWENEWLNFHRHGRASSGCAEGINNKIEVLERKAYGFRRAVNHQARILLECAGHPLRHQAA